MQAAAGAGAGADTISVYQAGVDLVRTDSARLAPHFEHIRNQTFFRYYAVDLMSSCTYMPLQESPCEMDKCDIDPAEDVPDILRERDNTEYDFRLDGWTRWDMPGDFTDYYDLTEVPERWTEYEGQKVWKFIHERICFQLRMDDPENAWKGDFNRAVSGLHSSISAHILEDMMRQKGWGYEDEEAAAEYQRRIGGIPGAEENLHFAFMIMLCAIHAAEPRLDGCTYMGTGAQVLPSMRALNADPLLNHPEVQRAAEELRLHARSSKAKVWKARLRTRDLLGAMNCVECKLCRLHGKVAALGLASALDVLIGQEGGGGDYKKLHRVEVAALLTTAAKMAHALEVVHRFGR